MTICVPPIFHLKVTPTVIGWLCEYIRYSIWYIHTLQMGQKKSAFARSHGLRRLHVAWASGPSLADHSGCCLGVRHCVCAYAGEARVKIIFHQLANGVPASSVIVKLQTAVWLFLATITLRKFCYLVHPTECVLSVIVARGTSN